MGSIINNLFGTVADKSADETIAFSAMSAAAASAAAYFAATLEATTPEVRRLFSEYLSQGVMAHEALTGLSINKGWASPYDAPVKQLQTSVQTSQSVISPSQQ